MLCLTSPKFVASRNLGNKLRIIQRYPETVNSMNPGLLSWRSRVQGPSLTLTKGLQAPVPATRYRPETIRPVSFQKLRKLAIRVYTPPDGSRRPQAEPL